MSDDEGSSDVARSKVELDVERHLLGTTVQLSDGTEGLVFSRGPKNESQMFLYNCHLCSVPNLPGERCLQTHISGRKHQMRMTHSTVDAETFRAPLAHKAKIQMNIAPGEPIPPGFENEVKPIPEIQGSLDRYKENALVGLEYVVELTNSYDKEPGYICVLCDKRGDPRTIINHLISFNHRLKYLEKHYQSVIKELAPFRYNPNARNVMPTVIQAVCEAIEKHYGRLLPSVYGNDEFAKNRSKVLQEIISDRHYDEKHGPNFINVVDKRMLQDAIKSGVIIKDALKIGKIPNVADNMKRRGLSPPIVKPPKRSKADNFMLSRRGRDSLDSISSISSSSIEDYRLRRDRKLSRSDSRSRSHSRSDDRERRKRQRRKSQSPAYRLIRYSRSPPFSEAKRPSKSDRKSTSKSDRGASQNFETSSERNKWEKYRRSVESGAKELEKALKEHEKNPEKHPLYPDEWKKFWNRRYKELQAEKKDPNKHDFKPEWIVFWTKRMKELHEDALEKMKSEIKRNLNLPGDKDDRKKVEKLQVIDISDDDDSLSTHSNKKSSPKRRARSPRPSISPISDEYVRREKPLRRSREHGRERERERDVHVTRDRYGPSADYYYLSSSRSYYPPAVPSSRYGYRTMDSHSYPQYEPEPQEEVEEGPLTVVAVLRLLTALEEHLGSLGPKIIDLLAKALALEKIKANSADELLLNEDNSVFFETVKEKLKGQLIAGVLDQNKLKAVKKAIKDIAAIIYQVTSNAKKTEEGKDKENDSKKIEHESKLLKDQFDRKTISSKLAAALVAEDKVDVSTRQMDQLINIFILMVKISKERKAVVKVTDILKDLNIPVPVDSMVEESIAEEKAMSPASVVDTKDEEENGIQSSMGPLESLTDSDLQILLQNFKHLSSEEQHHLIAHLKKLETVDPSRVEKLRKFVDISDLKKEKSKSPVEKAPSDYESNKNNNNTQSDEENSKRMQTAFDSDDDDDYNFDDVVRAASNNLKDKDKEKSNKNDSLNRERESDVSNMSKLSNASTTNMNISLTDTQNLIANLMGSLQKNSLAQAKNENSVSSIPTILGRQIQNESADNMGNPQESKNFVPDSNNLVSDPNYRYGNSNTYQNIPTSYNPQPGFAQQNFPSAPFASSQQQLNQGVNLLQQLMNQTQQQMFATHNQTGNNQKNYY